MIKWLFGSSYLIERMKGFVNNASIANFSCDEDKIFEFILSNSLT